MFRMKIIRIHFNKIKEVFLMIPWMIEEIRPLQNSLYSPPWLFFWKEVLLRR